MRACPDRSRPPDHDQAWWRSAVIYQIYPRSFCDSNGDGVGDLAGITGKLDYIAGLGVDAIWLSPFFVSPQADFGYDVADHCAVDPLFGTLDDFDRLLARAHELDLRVLIDQVWSHTSVEHAWFESSRAARTGPHADWYVWADARPDGTPPNNWLSVFGGSAWTWDARRRQYYLHHFLSSQPQLNLHNPQVRQAVLAAGEFWLARGVDGFRLDAIDFYLHDPLLRDNPPNACQGAPLKPFALQQHRYDMLHEGIPQFLAEIRALADRWGAVTLGEVSSQEGACERIHRYTRGHDRLHLAYTLRLSREPFTPGTFHDLIDRVARSDQPGAACWSFNNHDVERAISRWSGERDARFHRLLMALSLTLKGAVCLYQGEELALTESRLAREDLRDPFGIAYYPSFRGRDGSRTPMPWDATQPHAGFTTAPRPWLPVSTEHVGLAARQAHDDPESLLHAYRAFLTWRRQVPDFAMADMTPVPVPQPLLAFRRGSVLCMFNLAAHEVAVEVAGVRPLDGHGFACELVDGRAHLPGYGVFLGRLLGIGVAVAHREDAIMHA